MKEQRRKSRIEKIIGLLFILILFVFMVINIAVPDREMSEKENRMLAERPSLTMGTVMNGDFMEQWENYQSDQFAGRDFWRGVKVFLDRLGGARMENGVYIGKGGQLLEEIEVPDDGQSEANLSAIADFAEKYPDIQTSVMLVPDAACILSDSLPAFAGVEDQRQLLGVAEQRLGDSVNWIDAVSVLNNHVSDKLYYKTDHHWTTLAAFYVFRESAASLGIDGEVGDNFASYTISNDFNGVLAAKSGVGLSEKETIDIYAPTQGDDDVVVSYVDEGRKTTSLYDSSKLETRDQYGVFLGGNSSVIDIKTVSPEKKRLLVIKDSFANCFIPFLAPYYREIVVVDPRYYSGTIGDIMDAYRITDALVLYSGNTFFTDNHLSGVLTGE
ncbi:MAG TPA: hypothetical protein H9910_04405 [Candidatus Mediterraneibacter quadrami]|uniref:DHHW protein n=1 Tax=Candidatus Mediterraneibacter quadrami TaxID=2838684 RepID=A0A9D2REC4_9FIRM|nr:hypothetical protein [Candidatus Mediterraneibacter quadrami]